LQTPLEGKTHTNKVKKRRKEVYAPPSEENRNNKEGGVNRERKKKFFLGRKLPSPKERIRIGGKKGRKRGEILDMKSIPNRNAGRSGKKPKE